MRDFQELVTETGALPQDLIEHCVSLTSIPAARVHDYATCWYTITRTFGLGAAGYQGVIADRIKCTYGKKRDAWEALLQKAALISHDDLGLPPRGAIGGGIGLIHYRLFERMCRKLGRVEISEITLAMKLARGTIILTDAIERLFMYPEGGVVAFRVVEYIAYSIVQHQLPLFLAAERKGKKLYQREELDYILLHLEIEAQHAGEARELVDLLRQAGGNMPMFELLTRQFCMTLAAFWQEQETLLKA